MPARIDLETRLNVVKLRQNGQSWAEIAEALHLRSRYSARSIYSRWEKNGTVEPKKSSGRPKKTSTRDEKQLVSIVKKDRFATLKEIRCSYNAFHPCHSLSARTIRNILKKYGLRSRHAAKKLKIGPKTYQKRLKFCRKGIPLGLDYWKTVAFTDEVRFSVQTDGLVRVWRCAGERFAKNCTISRTSSKFSVMYWGLITYGGYRCLLPCPLPYNSSNYIETLRSGAVEELSEAGITLLDDNAPVHRSYSVKRWLSENMIDTVEWPPYSPDLNIIENVWGKMKKNMICSQINKENLHEIVMDAWNKIDDSFIKKLYEGFEKRLRLCIRAKGAPIPY